MDRDCYRGSGGRSIDVHDRVIKTVNPNEVRVGDIGQAPVTVQRQDAVGWGRVRTHHKRPSISPKAVIGQDPITTWNRQTSILFHRVGIIQRNGAVIHAVHREGDLLVLLSPEVIGQGHLKAIRPVEMIVRVIGPDSRGRIDGCR
ncbi:hypothetical protein N8693_00005, partial [Verrucomicrobia bacterium]|nr:hypothetical protein [Verrucomicrobiota bacterium]